MNYKGYEIKIETSPDTQNPLTDWDGWIGHFVCFHNRYELGHQDHNFSHPDDFKEWAEEMGSKVEMLGLYLYDHGGITMSTGSFADRWDSGQVGWIYTTLERLNNVGHNWKRWSKKRREQARKWMQEEVETYDQYLTGDIYSWMVEFEDGDYDCCSGYYGDDHEGSGLLESAKDAIDHHISSKIDAHLKIRKAQMKNRVPLRYREPLKLTA